MKYINKAALIACSMLTVGTVQAGLINDSPTDELESSLFCSNSSVPVCRSADVPSGSYDIVSELLDEYDIGDIIGNSQIVGYRSAVYCDPSSLIIHSSAGTLDTGDLLLRSRERVIDGVWEGEAQVSWYQLEASEVPEPSTLLLMTSCMAGIGLAGRKRKASAA
jgi:hypothetical protein